MLPVYKLDGSPQFPLQFFAAQRLIDVVEDPPPLGLEDDDKVKGFVGQLWEKTYKAHEPEHDRMRRCQLYYDGWHYENPRENFENEVTNFPAAMVETIHAELTENKPRPEIIPTSDLSEERAKDLGKYAEYLMNNDGFDKCWNLSTREFLKLGWCANLIAFDHRNGMPYPKPWCNWDIYRDYCARHDDDMQYLFLASPVPTRVLRALFPDKAKDIMPDGWLSPSYDALERPEREAMMYSQTTSDVGTIVPHIVQYPDPIPATSTYLSPPRGAYDAYHGETTFLLQLFFRDLTTKQIGYVGKRWGRDQSGMWHWHWDTQMVPKQVCESGWRTIQMTAAGLILGVSPLDPCYYGLPVTIGRNYEQAFRGWSKGEVDLLIGKTRAYNRRDSLLNLSLEYQSTPLMSADTNTGIKFDRGDWLPGEVMVKRPGTQIEVMSFTGPPEHQFLKQQGTRSDIEMLVGAYDASRGDRPPGVEAGVAIERLQAAASRRIRGKEHGLQAHAALLVKKLMICAAKKLNRKIQFIATDGKMVTIDPEWLASEFGVRFIPGSGISSSRLQRKAEALELYSSGVIDELEVLEVYQWPNRVALAQRMAERAMQMKAMEAAEASKSGGSSAKK